MTREGIPWTFKPCKKCEEYDSHDEHGRNYTNAQVVKMRDHYISKIEAYSAIIKKAKYLAEFSIEICHEGDEIMDVIKAILESDL